MPGQYDLQPSFPIAGVAQLYADRSTKEAQARLAQNQQLIQGINQFGQGVQSLVERRNAMAQALAQAQIFAQTPEGQQVMAPTKSPTPGYGSPVTSGAEGPAGPTTMTPSPVNMDTLKNALVGETPGSFLSSLQTQATNKRAYDLESQKEESAQKIAHERLQGLLAIFKGGLDPKYAGINQQATASIQNNITSLQQKKAELTKDLPSTLGTYWGNDKAKSARDQIAQIDKQIADYQKQLTPAQDAGHLSTAELLSLVNGQ